MTTNQLESAPDVDRMVEALRPGRDAGPRQPSAQGPALPGTWLERSVVLGFGVVVALGVVAASVFNGDSGGDVDQPASPVARLISVDSPAVGPQADRRGDHEVHRVAAQATLKVVGRSCGSLVSGSGFLLDHGMVDVASPLLVTNQHVAGQSTTLKVDNRDATMADNAASVVMATDSSIDLAVGTAVGDAAAGKRPYVLTPAQRAAQPGDAVVVSGFAGGRGIAVANGVVKAVVPGRSYGFHGDVVLIDGPNGDAAPGISGGPVLNTGAEVVAVVAATDRSTGLLVAVAGDELHSFISSAVPSAGPSVDPASTVDAC